MDRWATFDCYGTLIDWEGGLRSAYAALWPGSDTAALVTSHHRIEPDVQADAAVPYREVLARTLRRVAEHAGLSIPSGRDDALAGSLPGWAPFPEVPSELAELRSRGWRLAILSNTDPDLLAASVAAIGVEVDLRITAAEAGSYKPAPGHWDAFAERSGADPARHVHVGASLYHDIEPAAAMGIRAVWINRLGQHTSVAHAAALPTLAGLADALDGIVG